MPVSAYDVARLAGVSQAAVSRAFTPGASISQRMRDRVMSAAQTLGYRPNLLARSLSMGRSDLVGVVVGNAHNPAFTGLFEALALQLARARKQMFVMTGEDEDSLADLHVDDLMKYRVGAVVLISADVSQAVIAECRATGIPIIFLGRLVHPSEDVVSVSVSATMGARQVVRHLAAQGYRRLAHIVGFEASGANGEGQRAFVETARQEGLSDPQIVVGHFQREGTKAAVRSLLAHVEPPDAIFCQTDHMAIAAMEVARSEFGLRIGPDLGVVGFDDMLQAAWPSVDLTSYSQPTEAMIGHTMAILQGELTAPDTRRIVFEGELKARGSTRR